MSKKDKPTPDKKSEVPPPHNPADEGVDHNLSEGAQKDLKESYIKKQESNGGRGIDNEDTTE